MLGLAYFVVHIFRMALFFMVAGFFARLLHQRLGTAGLIKNRLRRIGLPFLAAMVLIIPPAIGANIWGRCRSACTAAHRLAQALPSSVHQFH
ncbi:acyltransferase family protein [Mycobacterium xenopi 4042]|uniref:Acyltransferase family protein n=1 Tax=Mycobacterium xenopi 4042 TaxID=1299334 RepID=X7ZI39_MYCXE|nr:acyltransferase family protein [Mycobacterium xenopi 4042]